LTLLQVEHLSVEIGGNRVVDDVSFTVDRGERLGIIGESGSGKTLSALSIIGLAPDVASVTGSVVLDGVELLGRTDRELARIRGDGIAMVFQNPMTSLNPVMRVGRQISEPLRIHQGLSRSEAANVALDWCRRVGLPDPERTVNAYPHQLSGGQRQRVGIAIALACSPALLIADEPTTALDVTVQADVLALLDTLIAEQETALVFITHDIALVSEVAHSVVVMREGRIVEHGRADELVRRPGHEYTAQLVAAARRTSWAGGADGPGDGVDVGSPVDEDPVDEVPA
jgi:peptide/nickel transport system ATP-binding protein